MGLSEYIDKIDSVYLETGMSPFGKRRVKRIVRVSKRKEKIKKIFNL